MTKKRKRRREGEGTIIERKDGSFLGQISAGTDQEGKRRRYSFVGRTRQEVIDKMARARYEMKAGIHVDPTKLTVGRWLDIWLDIYAKQAIRPSTYESYRQIIRTHLKPSLGSLELQALQPHHIQSLYTEKQKIYSPSTVRHMYVILNQALAQAEKERTILVNPVKATRPPRITRPEAQYLKAEQINQMLEVVKKDRWHTMILFTLATGTRRGEVCALRWENVDLEEGIVYVKESVRRVKTFEEDGPKTRLMIQPPKSEKGIRVIPLPNGLITELRKHKAKQAEEKLKIGEYYKDQGFVFAWEGGDMVKPDYYSRYFGQIVKECGFEGISLHSLRHSYASALLRMGESAKVVQEILGHSTISVTLDTYSHVHPDLKRRAAKKMDEFLTKKKPSSGKEG